MSFPEPRQHPYLFTHSALRDALARKPARVMEALGGPDAASWLAQLWEATGAELEPEERLPTPHFHPALHPLPTGWLLAFLPLPTPLETGECYLAAVLYKPPTSRLLFLKTTPEALLFVLERGLDRDDGSARAYVAVYHPDGRRERLGDVDAPTEDALLARIQATPGTHAAFDSGAGR